MTTSDTISQAATWISQADALLITAGAGMGVDSGLPDFRGNEGFWNAYPPFRRLGLSFYDLANPIWFRDDPEQAWGFYGHRFNMYRETQPHPGFSVLLDWARHKSQGYFVFTSNVDGHFQTAGFDGDRVLECHGSFATLQCAAACTSSTWPADDLELSIDETTFRAQAPLPACPNCGACARPNILMFGDGDWLDVNRRHQVDRYHAWLSTLPADASLAIIELGAGTAVPTVRWESEQLLQSFRNANLIRINPREPEGPAGTCAIDLGALDALLRIQDAKNKNADVIKNGE